MSSSKGNGSSDSSDGGVEMKKKVLFIHPDLGIGGAEKAIVDMAVSLQQSGFTVKIATAHHDAKRAFPETTDGTLDVTCVGDFLPRAIFGRFVAVCAYIRMIYVALWTVLFMKFKPDLVICDQISACVPVLKVARRRVFFYCHYPDLLLSPRKSFIKKLYRWPVDFVEWTTTAMSDRVVVNSHFTAGVVRQTFPRLSSNGMRVLYPVPADLTPFAPESPLPNCVHLRQSVLGDASNHLHINHIFVSINRYERKKDVDRAILSLAELRRQIPPKTFSGIRLVIAGGYDTRLKENVDYFAELVQLAAELHVESHVVFFRNISMDEKVWLLKKGTCLVYTPDREHFGIGPIESMAAGCPVIACASGGPLETVVNGTTGFLCEPSAVAFADAMRNFVEDKELASKLGKASRQHVLDNFSSEVFRRSLVEIVKETIQV